MSAKQTKPNSSISGFLRDYRLGLSFMGIVVLSFVLLYVFTDHDPSDCKMHTLHHECDLSGWAALLIGDVIMGMVLALLFHYVSKHSNKKIDAARAQIDEIIMAQQRVHNKRETYVIQALKNDFSALMLCIGIIDMFGKSEDPKKQQIAGSKTRDLEQLLHKGQSVLSISIDVLDPLLIQQIESLFTSIEAAIISKKTKSGASMDLAPIKSTIKTITAKLDTYEHSDDIIK